MPMNAEIQPGNHIDLGAHSDGKGTNFALFSENAEAVDLCLFDHTGSREIARYELPEKTHDVWHGYLPGIEAGALYGYRVRGPYDPRAGHRFNHNKLLIDPYSRRLHGDFRWHNSQYGFIQGDAKEDLSFDSSDNSQYLPKSVVSGSALVKPIHSKPKVPWHQTSIYELHPLGFTKLHPYLSESERGTLAGLSHPQAIKYIKALGITSIELLPIHAHIDEAFIVSRGLSNYWGYNSLSFFAPHQSYLQSGDLGEIRSMVQAYHEAGIEVILDVVYNHTSESNHLGPTHSFRGIDNASYYRLQAESSRYYVNDTGCGNTLNISHPRVLQLVMDSLRYWSEDIQVDGFRFDLAPILGREKKGFSTEAAFFQALAQDPILKRTKLIAEPWDIGPSGYQLGSFPAGWSEWNDEYRDTLRRFWRRDPGNLPTLARRLHGSSDIFERSGRRPDASINYVASHDGFTLTDLVSYQRRHNEANAENNADGHRTNLSENFGVEGATEDPKINAARRKQQRNLLATLFISQGVPMIQAGDEFGRSLQGNNNAYCQDNESSWIDWTAALETNKDQVAFVTRLIRLRKQFPIFSHSKYIHANQTSPQVAIKWINSEGQKMREEHWQEHHSFLLGYQLLCLSEPKAEYPGSASAPHSTKYSVLVLFNNCLKIEKFILPEPPNAQSWHCLIDTSNDDGIPAEALQEPRSQVMLQSRSVAIFSSTKPEVF